MKRLILNQLPVGMLIHQRVIKRKKNIKLKKWNLKSQLNTISIIVSKFKFLNSKNDLELTAVQIYKVSTFPEMYSLLLEICSMNTVSFIGTLNFV